MKKQCKQCKELKSMQHFLRDDKKDDGRKSTCNKCVRNNNKTVRNERINDRRFLNQFLPI